MADLRELASLLDSWTADSDFEVIDVSSRGICIALVEIVYRGEDSHRSEVHSQIGTLVEGLAEYGWLATENLPFLTYDWDGNMQFTLELMDSELRAEYDGPLYHLTPTKNLDSIMRDGLLPHQPGTVQHAHYGVYLFTSLRDAQDIVMEQEDTDSKIHETWAVLQVDGSGLRLYLDCEYRDYAMNRNTNTPRYLFTDTAVLPSRIKVLATALGTPYFRSKMKTSAGGTLERNYRVALKDYLDESLPAEAFFNLVERQSLQDLAFVDITSNFFDLPESEELSQFVSDYLEKLVDSGSVRRVSILSREVSVAVQIGGEYASLSEVSLATLLSKNGANGTAYMRSFSPENGNDEAPLSTHFSHSNSNYDWSFSDLVQSSEHDWDYLVSRAKNSAYDPMNEEAPSDLIDLYEDQSEVIDAWVDLVEAFPEEFSKESPKWKSVDTLEKFLSVYSPLTQGSGLSALMVVDTGDGENWVVNSEEFLEYINASNVWTHRGNSRWEYTGTQDSREVLRSSSAPTAVENFTGASGLSSFVYSEEEDRQIWKLGDDWTSEVME